MTESLAVFVDRYTMRYDRRYTHPIGLVWEAVSTSDHLDVWLLPVTRVDRRVGGRCSFTWGGPEEEGMEVGEVTDFDPPRLITYTFPPPAGFMRFELEPDGDATILHFTLWWPVPPGASMGPEDWPGGDLPAGPHTAWRPGALAGFHLMLDDLASYLRGEFNAADRAASFESAEHAAMHEAWIVRYRDHVREHCPPD